LRCNLKLLAAAGTVSCPFSATSSMASADLKKLFAERVTLAPGSTTWLQVRLSGRGFGDDQMVALGRFLTTLLGGKSESAPSGGGEVCANVELAENAIGSTGLMAVLDALEKNHVSCKCLKLFKNKIGDEGGFRLARVVANQATAVEELHLSHNALTQRSLVALCMAIGKHDAYPQLGRNRLYIPCWLRMEYNHISRPLEVVEVLRRDGEVSICTAENREECGPWRCSHAGRTTRGVPKVHLFTISVQSRNHRPGIQDDAELREDIRRWGGRAVAPSMRLPASRQPLGASGAAPSPASRPSCPKAGLPTPSPSGRGWGAPHGSAGAPPNAWAAGAAAPGQTGPCEGNTAVVASADDGRAPAPTSAEDPSASQKQQQQGQPRPAQNADGFGPPGCGPASTTQCSSAFAGGGSAAVAAPSTAQCATGGYPSDVDGAGSRPPEARPAASPARPRAWEAPAAGHPPAEPSSRACPESAVEAEKEVKGGRKDEDAGEDTQVAPPPTAVTAATTRVARGPDCSRASLLLDAASKRRIAPAQLEGSDGSSNQFVCRLCSFVMVKPVVTSCIHLFCDSCFRSYVGDQVSKQKSKSAGAVPLLPCPWQGCTQQLRKQDITALDQAGEGGKIGAAALLQRLRNNLRVKCVHHADLFEQPFGSDAAEIKCTRQVSCSWMGDLTGYDDHLRKNCPVEQLCRSREGGAGAGDGGVKEAEASPTASPGAGLTPSAGATAAQQVVDRVRNAGGGDVEASSASSHSAANGNAAQPSHANGNAPRRHNAVAADGEVRIAQYDYIPENTDRAQIALKQHDLVRVFEVTASGWAAGVRLSKRTKEEIGEAGWFPAAYLVPSRHVAAEAA